MSNPNEGLEQLLNSQNPPARQRRQRTNFNESQIEYLDTMFTKNPYPDINERMELAAFLKTSEDRIQVWFQNKRARYRKKMGSNNSKENKRATSNKTSPTHYSSSDDSGYQSQILNTTPTTPSLNYFYPLQHNSPYFTFTPYYPTLHFNNTSTPKQHSVFKPYE